MALPQLVWKHELQNSWGRCSCFQKSWGRSTDWNVLYSNALFVCYEANKQQQTWLNVPLSIYQEMCSVAVFGYTHPLTFPVTPQQEISPSVNYPQFHQSCIQGVKNLICETFIGSKFFMLHVLKYAHQLSWNLLLRNWGIHTKKHCLHFLYAVLLH